VEAWLAGTMTADGHFDLHDVHGAVLTGTWAASTVSSGLGGSVNGTITVGGRIWHFTVGPAKKPAGLYRPLRKSRAAKEKSAGSCGPTAARPGSSPCTASPPQRPRSTPRPVPRPWTTVVHAEPIDGFTRKGDF